MQMLSFSSIFSCAGQTHRLVPLSSTPPSAHIAPRIRAVKPEVPPVVRRSGNFPLSLWDKSYLQSLRTDFKEEHASRIEKLKEATMRLIEEEKEVVEQLQLVDVLQQLGLGYHFEQEILAALKEIYESMGDIIMVMDQDLYSVALLFRLLREHGFTLSQDIFDSFKDSETGEFNSSVDGDTKAILSLYQASYFGMEGERTLDEAKDFTTRHLNELIKGSTNILEPCLVEQVNYALKLPLHWRLNRMHCRWFIEKYEREEKMNPMLLELAKLDFNMVQSGYKKELTELSRWWTELDICGNKLSFSRDRLVENFLGVAVWVFEPKMWRCREALTKLCGFITTIDDVYDIYGSLDELEIFTDAVERWDVNAIEKLPEYMKICFLALYNTANEISYKTLKDKSVDIVPYLKRMWTDQCKGYLLEAKWYHKGYVPTFDEYLKNARITVASHVVLSVAHFVNDHVTVEGLEHSKSYREDLTPWPSTIMRLCNDMTTSSHEIERGDNLKSVECYMHEKHVSEALAREYMWNLVNLSWKRLNGEQHFAASSDEKFLRMVAFNNARSAQLFYQHEDGYGKNHNREIKDSIISLFFEPILL